MVTVGSDFNVAGVNCTSNGYTCTVAGNQFSLEVSSAGILSPITLSNIITPSLSPSTLVTVETYSSGGFLIDRSSTIRWLINC